MKPSRIDLLLDVAERTFWTFLQAAAAVLIVEQDWTIDIVKIAATAGVIAVLKGIVASQIGVKNSAATLPKEAQE